MPALIDATKLREYFDINKDINSTRLTPHIGAASRRLKKWVGTDAYADALLENPTNAERKEDLTNAEAALAMHFALPGINTKVTPSGVVKTSKTDQGTNIITYLSPKEIDQLKALYLEQAEEIARPYLLNDGTPEAEFAVVTDE